MLQTDHESGLKRESYRLFCILDFYWFANLEWLRGIEHAIEST